MEIGCYRGRSPPPGAPRATVSGPTPTPELARGRSASPSPERRKSASRAEGYEQDGQGRLRKTARAERRRRKRVVPHADRAYSGDVQQHAGGDHGSGGQCLDLVVRWTDRLQGFPEGHALRGSGGWPERRQSSARDLGVRSASMSGSRDREPVANPRFAPCRRAAFRIKSIKDVTPIPHNGCRPRKRRRV